MSGDNDYLSEVGRLNMRINELEEELRVTRASFDINVAKLSEIIASQAALLETQDSLIGARASAAKNPAHCLEIGTIKDATSVLGAEQGYLPLPARFFIEDMTPKMQTAWEFTPEQRRLVAEGAPLILEIIGKAHPPVMLMIGVHDA